MALPTDDAYLRTLAERVRRDDFATAETLALAEEAVAVFPGSPRLWCWRGDLIQISDGDDLYELDDARKSYEQALVLDPDNAQALARLGHFYDAVAPDAALAEQFFLRAIAQGAGPSAFLSLAEAYLESGRAQDALALLAPDQCPHLSDPEIVHLRDKAAALIASTGPEGSRE